ncbi:glycosyltransferase family 33 protein [Trametes coccinea BRFM310]|uniref:Chitobiosyldiphosphodolichol beta-mannosyltransferase n=1 Tax=Trametes coccinea (strain BRFM310) TaxID=1353009 RepID=A0A1Y2IWV0_TRAC3|nr:glycosyltransferase family 33 protein [Trametes coccinea BRFM310]
MADSPSAIAPSSAETAWKVLALLAATYFLWHIYAKPRPKPALRSVAVLVLGDIGRSPRMMYHAESFALNKFQTYLIGYRGSKPIPSLLSLPRINILYLSEPPSYLRGLPFIIAGPLKVLSQVIDILRTLLERIPHPPEFILVQNPPSIPTLAVVWLVSRLRGSKVIIDWHNLGYSILALKLGEQHAFVRLAKRFEKYFGRSAYAHLFVTNAMREYLVQEWDLQGRKVVLHDRPPARFHRASPSESHELFQHLLPSFSSPSLTSFLPTSKPPYSTPFTYIPPSRFPPSGPTLDVDLALDMSDLSPFAEHVAMPELRGDRPALLVTSTSWTPDEDFGMLLDALKQYELAARAREGLEDEKERLPKILMAVTGKGPLRQRYMREVERLQMGSGQGDEGGWRYVRCASLWLEADDYPLLLGSADLGISLHSSSSGRDLPMKVVDMFGCGLPVCALGFACLDELVKDGVNGLVFHNAEQLAAQLESLLRGFPSAPALAALQASFQQAAHAPAGSPDHWEWGTWAENWNRTMRPLLLHDVASEAAL